MARFRVEFEETSRRVAVIEAASLAEVRQWAEDADERLLDQLWDSVEVDGGFAGVLSIVSEVTA